jgi:hypothetical protein
VSKVRYFSAMTSPVVRSIRPLAIATAVVAAGAGSAAAGEPATVPPADAPGCAEITLALDAVDAFGFAFATGDLDTVQSLLTQLPEIGAEAAAAAPDDIAETVETWVAPLPLIVATLADIDPSDADAFEQAVTAIDTGSSETARQEVQAWAAFNCGWTSAVSAEQIEAPEPPDCEVLDAAAAAEAAGIDIDVDDLDGSADISLPGFWTKSCSYGNGAMSLSTFSFNTVEDAQRFYADNLTNTDGVVLDVDLGSLPESSLVIQTGVAPSPGSSVPATDESDSAVTPTVQVAVFEAPIPFSVTFTGSDVDPAAVVAAAEALVAAPPSDTQPPTTDVATTA